MAVLIIRVSRICHLTTSSTSSFDSAEQRLTPHSRTLEVRPGRINKKLELHEGVSGEDGGANGSCGEEGRAGGESRRPYGR